MTTITNDDNEMKNENDSGDCEHYFRRCKLVSPCCENDFKSKVK